jgi:DNA-directed RNA polymerase subunit F
MRQHAIPTAADLVEAVREFLVEEVRSATSGRVEFLARVAGNALAIVERELRYGPEDAARHAERLARLGMHDDRELAREIRSGALDDRIEEVVAAVRADTLERLRVANPRWLTAADADELDSEPR